VSPLRYELGFYIPEDGILHSHSRENVKSYLIYVLYYTRSHVARIDSRSALLRCNDLGFNALLPPNGLLFVDGKLTIKPDEHNICRKYSSGNGHQNADVSYNIEGANMPFEGLSHFKYLETTVTNRNLIQEEFKGRLNSGNACYHSFQNLLSPRLLSKNVYV
jgi:hypothetical protein